MKCPHCKENLDQDDYNICPFCEKPIKNLCPHCGEELDQPDYSICPFCTQPLKSKPKPKRAARKKPQKLAEKPSAPPAKEPPAPEPVVVQVEKEKKRRLNPLWLLLILLLLLVCCCGLLITEQVEVPEFAQPYIEPLEPYLENMREAFRGFIDRQQPPAVEAPKPKEKEEEEEVDCGDEELIDQIFNDVDLQFLGCEDGVCTVLLENTEDVGDLELIILPCFEHNNDCLDREIVRCDNQGGFHGCDFEHPHWPGEDEGFATEFDFEVMPEGCDVEDGLYVNPGPWDADGNRIGEVLELAQEKEEPIECCEIVDVTGVRYESVPGVKRILQLDPICDADWPLNPGECIPGATFIGEDHDIFWADVTCCAESDDLSILHCESDYSVEQKVSWTVVRLEHEGCEWESPRFYSPAYFKGVEESEEQCPSGQIMCGGVCCNPSDCSGGECY